MIFLIDHNLKGHALVLFGAIASQGWLDMIWFRSGLSRLQKWIYRSTVMTGLFGD